MLLWVRSMYKLKDMSWVPYHPCKKPKMATGACYPSTGRGQREQDYWGFLGMVADKQSFWGFSEGLKVESNGPIQSVSSFGF